jgi:translocation and assembly module TamB
MAGQGRLTITGTSAAPAISGRLEQIRGSVDLLGKTFTLTRGVISFDGTAKPDPALDIVAEASAADITGRSISAGLPQSRKSHCSSPRWRPPSPVGVRVRSIACRGSRPRLVQTGLRPHRSDDRDPETAGTGTSATGGTALSAGKYIAPGVSVGVSRGII